MESDEYSRGIREVLKPLKDSYSYLISLNLGSQIAAQGSDRK
jgi:hypothetical protein